MARKQESFLTYVVLFFISLASMNVFNRYYFFIYCIIGLFFIKKNNRVLYFDLLPFMLLLVFGISWIAFVPETMVSTFNIIKPFTYLFCYVIGMSLLNDDVHYANNSISFRLFYLTVGVLAFGALAHYLLNWVTNTDSVSRNTIDFWTKDEMAATGQAALACLSLGSAGAVLFSKSAKQAKIAALAVIVLIMGYNLQLAGRTLVLMLLIVIAVAFFHQFILEKTGKIRRLFGFVFLILLLVAFYQGNLFGIRAYVEDSPIYDRFFSNESTQEFDEDNRMENKKLYIEEMDQYLFGGSHLHERYGYAHDILLDTYDEGGLFAFLAILMYLLVALSHLVRCVKDHTLPFMFRQIVLCVYVAVYLEFMVEPILQGMPWLFASFCLIDGYVNRLLNRNKTVQKTLGEFRGEV